ncbi:MAG TPA: hypothetical protein VID72_06245 [Ktedonobacterales bacterium]
MCSPTPASNLPTHGDHAADLVYDEQADPRRGGIWIYPACYDDFYLARRRAHSLSQSFGVPFRVDLFGARGDCGEVTPSVAISEPGYYAFTSADPRRRLIRIPRALARVSASPQERQEEEAQRP